MNFDFKKELEIAFSATIARIVFCEFLARDSTPEDTAKLFIDRWFESVHEVLENRYVEENFATDKKKLREIINKISSDWKNETKEALLKGIEICIEDNEKNQGGIDYGQ